MTPDQFKPLFDLLVHAGFSPFKLLEIHIFPVMALAWTMGTCSDAQMLQACENLNILNGGNLKATIGEETWEDFRMMLN